MLVTAAADIDRNTPLAELIVENAELCMRAAAEDDVEVWKPAGAGERPLLLEQVFGLEIFGRHAQRVAHTVDYHSGKHHRPVSWRSSVMALQQTIESQPETWHGMRLEPGHGRKMHIVGLGGMEFDRSHQPTGNRFASGLVHYLLDDETTRTFLRVETHKGDHTELQHLPGPLENTIAKDFLRLYRGAVINVLEQL